MKKIIQSVLVVLVAQIAHAKEKPVLLRTLNCKATVIKYIENVPVPDSKYNLSFTIKDYKSVIVLGDDFKEDSFWAELKLKSHPENSLQKLIGEFAANGGSDDVNAERDGDPRGRDGWQGLSWYDMYTKLPKFGDDNNAESVLRLLMKAKKKQLTAKVREYTLVLSYDGDVTTGNGYSDENATCTLVK